jgi:hypothetical protein
MEEASLSISFVFLPVSDVEGAIVPHQPTVAVSLVVSVHAFIDVARLEHMPAWTCDDIRVTFV